MSVDGSALGNILGISVFLVFQCSGYAVAAKFLKGQSAAVKLLAGSVFGTVLLQWLPVFFSFFLGFTLLSNCLAVCTAVLLALLLRVRKEDLRLEKIAKPSPLYLIPLGVFFFFSFLVIHGFQIENGEIYSSQCTYGDMPMHLGFITSIANQGTFPPEYSILTGTPLSYPFLSDSVSSSLYVFGASLQISYMLPMFFAGAQVFGGFLLLAKLWLKTLPKTILAFVLFFLNGGFGFFYFLSGVTENPENFTRIFTNFYETPTNHMAENVRWVNIIVDMLVPQRATLFGWAVLFTALLFLYKAVSERKKSYFVITGILAGALPMIHTHSFLVLALVSLCWLFFVLWEAVFDRIEKPAQVVKILLVALPIALTLIQPLVWQAREQKWMLQVVSAAVLVLVLLMAVLLIKCKEKRREIFSTWGIYFLIAVALAVPQLLMWTLRQASGDYFTRGHFNWGNVNDQYLWFYLKNIGMVAIFIFPAILWAGKEKLRILSPVFLLWFVAEFVVFQPNDYDNNKLLYVAYLFICVLVADYLVELYVKLGKMRGRALLAAFTILLCTGSALLTFGRESVARYELVNAEDMLAEQYIEENSTPTDVILTDTRHNNAISALSGRNLVCGSPSYVFYHGLDYNHRLLDLQRMYEQPQDSQELFSQYSVDYILISEYERESYVVAENAIEEIYPCVFERGKIRIFKVKEGTA